MISTQPLRVQARVHATGLPGSPRRRCAHGGPAPLIGSRVRALRRECAASMAERAGMSACQPDHVRLRPLLTLRDLELDSLAFFEGAVAVHLDRAVVDENIRTTVDRDEAVPLLRVEPFDGALSHS